MYHAMIKVPTKQQHTGAPLDPAAQYAFASSTPAVASAKNSMRGEKQKTKVSRLNQSDLAALFRRLDVNGNGDLSFSEFKSIVTKLNLTSPSVIDSLNDVFNMANTDTTGSSAGSLDLKEFCAAYDILYNKLLNDSESSSGEVDDSESNYVKATRYGFFGTDDKGDKKYIFEVYTGTIANISTKFIYDLPNVDDDESKELTSSAIDISKIEYKTVVLTNYNVETINRLILEDGARNVETGARVMWWVDFCSRTLKSSELSKVSKAFGIPSEIRDDLELPSERRLFFGSGEVVCESIGKIAPAGFVGRTSMLSMFPQSFYLKNKPVVDRDPAFMRAIPFGIGTYLSSRFAMFYDLHAVPCHEKQKVVRQVNIDITALLDQPTETFVDNVVETPTLSTNGASSHTSPHKTFLPVPPVTEAQGAGFSLSTTDLRKRVPEIYNEMFSLHLQNQGYGPMALITIRKMDGELPDTPTQRWGIEQNSRSGIIGSTMGGIWLKLLEVTANEGVVNTAADLDDSSFSLALTIIVLLHNTSMMTTQSMVHWLEAIHNEIEDIAVTKHSKHIEKAEEMLGVLCNYVTSFNEAFQPMVDMYYKDSTGEPLQGGKDPSSPFDDRTSVFHHHPHSHSLGENDERKLIKHMEEHSYSITAACQRENPTREDGWAVLEDTKDLRSTYPFSEVRWDKAEDVTKYRVLKAFAISDTDRRIPELLMGVEKLEVEGTLFWQEALEAVSDTVHALHERYNLCLDEKRNLWGFTLGIVSIATFPFSVMTGYFGMNFENMAVSMTSSLLVFSISVVQCPKHYSLFRFRVHWLVHSLNSCTVYLILI